ncbi:hypothetical protein SAMN05192558_104303 [Actinokineospora alba]|uniref:Uncharacterized protein n=1 Tax=Actinokineospora alba TaxID=504798 RepID=A0A1H0LVP4_9PSEU|nr:hypothetical protein [Actinokineospora alba]TDP67475.1 hypothetical protein C8E96_3020 [Actinokineospora alba]SDI47373.1 hypothetical protein SAMN05421871_105157 [Actinokineospora alba]SDO72195.1 hypothetical protein SAMN05192558_104303 [Actinokineospora alba]
MDLLFLVLRTAGIAVVAGITLAVIVTRSGAGTSKEVSTQVGEADPVVRPK